MAVCHQKLSAFKPGIRIRNSIPGVAFTLIRPCGFFFFIIKEIKRGVYASWYSKIFALQYRFIIIYYFAKWVDNKILIPKNPFFAILFDLEANFILQLSLFFLEICIRIQGYFLLILPINTLPFYTKTWLNLALSLPRAVWTPADFQLPERFSGIFQQLNS